MNEGPLFNRIAMNELAKENEIMSDTNSLQSAISELQSDKKLHFDAAAVEAWGQAQAAYGQLIRRGWSDERSRNDLLNQLQRTMDFLQGKVPGAAVVAKPLVRAQELQTAPPPPPDPLSTGSQAIRALCALVHSANKRWWIDLHTGEPLQRNVGEMLMLIVSELAEAMEGHRKELKDDKLPHRSMFEVELADALTRLLDMAGGLELDLAGAWKEKMQFNAVREDHMPEHRLAEGGKKY